MMLHSGYINILHLSNLHLAMFMVPISESIQVTGHVKFQVLMVINKLPYSMGLKMYSLHEICLFIHVVAKSQ